MISRQRQHVIEAVDKLLHVLIKEYQLKGDSLSEALICKKALDIYGVLVKKTLGANLITLTSKQAEDGFKSLRKEVEFTVYLDMEMWQVQQEISIEIKK